MLGLPLFFSRFFLVVFCWLYIVDLSWSSIAFLYIVQHRVDLDFISFSFFGVLRVLSHWAYSGDILFFVGSLLQRRKIHSDFVGFTSPRGGKGPYFSFLTLRPGLLLCSDLSFSVIMEFNNTHTHIPSFDVRETQPLWFFYLNMDSRSLYIAYSCWTELCGTFGTVMDLNKQTHTHTHTHTHTFFRAPFHFVPWELADVLADCVAATSPFWVNSFALERSFEDASNTI